MRIEFSFLVAVGAFAAVCLSTVAIEADADSSAADVPATTEQKVEDSEATNASSTGGTDSATASTIDVTESSQAPASTQDAAKSGAADSEDATAKTEDADDGSDSASVGAEKAVIQEVDIDQLQQRLRDTEAIGFLTKLAVKSEVDALIEDFETYHGNGNSSGNSDENSESTSTIDQLRNRFANLVTKLARLLKDDDPTLARDITDSEPALWAMLSDPKQYSD